jgi:iron complex transport system permease protein
MITKRFSAWQVSQALALILVTGIVLSITQGAVSLPAGQSLLAAFDALLGTSLSTLSEYQLLVVHDLRMPRTLLAMLVGALLAMSGAVMQGLFRNPLADPGIIGVSAGAALGASLAIVLLPAALEGFALPVAAFAGGLLTTWLVYRLAQSSAGTSVVILLLAGVAISAFCGAAIGFLTYLADDQALRDLSLWQMGSVATVSTDGLWLSLIVVALLAFYFIRHAQALNALLLGESEARHLGINVEQLKIRFIAMTAVGIGVAVSVSGIIGFIGLVVPHLVRMMTGPDHRKLLPLSALMGASLLLIADLGARTVVAPAELPVGLITAILGAPFFIALLVQQRKGFY